MAGMKKMFAFGQSIENKENIFYCLRALLCRHLALLRCHLMTVVLILSSSFKKKKAQQCLPIHPRERLPTIAPEVLIFKLVDFISQTKSLSLELMLFVSSFGTFSRFQILLKIITIRLKRDT